MIKCLSLLALTWNRKNFERKYIISLLQLPRSDQWLFGGGFISHGCKYIESEKSFRYNTSELSEFDSLTGRLVLTFKRSGRQSYLNAQKWAEDILVTELKPEKMVVEEFPGYNKVKLPKPKLDLVVAQNIDTWKAALSSVSGVYLITDTITGKLYVGSATGEGGIWQRWSNYAKNGHGGNKELKSLLKNKGEGYSSNFQYSILEIADTHSSENDVLVRESYWKDVLCSRAYGYNAN
jgi:hypothetical protein